MLLKADLKDLKNYEYLESLQIPLIEKQKLSNIILQASSNKASKLDEILNCILHLFLSQILLLLLSLYNQCLRSSIYLRAFKQSVTVTLQKLNKGDYRVVKIYRSVALLNTLEKAIKSVMVRRLS